MTNPVSRFLAVHRARRQARIDREVERIRGWAAAPMRTMRQIAANVEPLPALAAGLKDTLPVPTWSLSISDRFWVMMLWTEIMLMQRKLLR